MIAFKNIEICDYRIFDSSLPLTEVTLSTSRIKDLIKSQKIENLLHVFNKYGFAIIECEPIEDMVEDFLLLTKIFGRTTEHNRADERGIVIISVREDFAAYLGASNEIHPLHTDGPFEKIPPKVMALQCEEPDPWGGLSLLVSARAIYQYLAQQDKEGLDLLFNPQVFSIQRDNQYEKRAIFDRKNDRIEMAFRTNDGKANISILPEAQKIFNLITEFIDNPKNQLQFKLEKGQILVVDNTAILHGRTGFNRNSPRKLHRLNFDGISPYSAKILFGFPE